MRWAVRFRGESPACTRFIRPLVYQLRSDFIFAQCGTEAVSDWGVVLLLLDKRGHIRGFISLSTLVHDVGGRLSSDSRMSKLEISGSRGLAQKRKRQGEVRKVW